MVACIGLGSGRQQPGDAAHGWRQLLERGLYVLHRQPSEDGPEEDCMMTIAGHCIAETTCMLTKVALAIDLAYITYKLHKPTIRTALALGHLRCNNSCRSMLTRRCACQRVRRVRTVAKLRVRVACLAACRPLPTKRRR